MKNATLFFLLFVFISLLTLRAKDNTSDMKLFAIKAQEKIVVDGELLEDIWQRPGFTGMQQQDPDQGEAPSQKSELWVSYDDEAVYFAAKFYDNNPDSIMARLVRRDFVWGDPSDGCVLYFDTYRDKRNGYFFYVSAAGTIADGLLQNDTKNTDLSWDAVWEGVPKLNSDGWTVEMKIPFSQLRFNDIEEQLWGINVERFISRRNETDMVAYTPRNESGFASRFPSLEGIKGVKPTSRIEILPYATGKAEYLNSESNNPLTSGENYLPGIGLDFKTGLGSSLTLDATINPDFGQVEVDPAIVNLTDVEYTFQEKRPFFTEGVTIFRFGRGGTNNNPTFDWSRPSLFYSRRIGRSPQGYLPVNDYADVPNGTRIIGAGKISGRILNDWKIGFINALTRREFADIDIGGKRFEFEVEPLTYYGIFRAQRDFDAGKHGIGVLSTFTNRFFKENSLQYAINKDAFIAGTDGWTFLDDDRTYVLTGWAGVSRVSGNQIRMSILQQNSRHYFQRPDASHVKVDTNATSMSGYAGRLMLNKNRGQFTFNTAVGLVSPEFEVNDLGYNSYSDRINTHFFTSYRWLEPTEYYLNCGLNAATFATYDFGGNRTAQGYWFSGYYRMHSFYGGNFNFTYNPSTYSARRTRGGPLTVNPVSRRYNLQLYTDNRARLVFYGGGNYRFGDDAISRSVYVNAEVKVTPTLTVSIGPDIKKDIYNAQWIDVFSDTEAKSTYGNRYVFAHLDQTTFSTDIRADWIISPKLSFQVYFQPFIASGKYKNFKTLQKPKSYDFLIFGEDGSTMEKTIDTDGDISYTLDPDGTGPAESQTLSNPDFNYISLRGNAVLRWEYMPGSTLYLVWTQSIEDEEPHGDFYFDKSMKRMFNLQPDNIFMLKISYWLGI
jgi:hypothetical protein